MNKISYELLRLETYINQYVDDKLTQLILLGELNLIRAKLIGDK